MKQNRAPLFERLLEYSKENYTSFDVPGHKQGRYTNRFNSLFRDTIRLDVNSMPELDLLSQPISIIKEAQELMADAFNFDNSFFLINGTTGGILAMIYASVSEGELIAVPRNVHRSIISAIILSGATPIFIEPSFDEEWMLLNQISLADIIKVHTENPKLKAVLIINPTYFGVVAEFNEIIDYCRDNNLISLVDQAHGTHFNFLDGYQYSSKPDLVAMSTHKTLGSLSQSSVLFHNNGLISHERVLKCLSLFSSTSASYLLMASLDEMRYDIVNNHINDFEVLSDLVKEYRLKINLIPGISVMDDSYSDNLIDPLKLTIKVNELNMSGFDVYKLLKKEYAIQLELAETYCVLAIISLADDRTTLDKLVNALQEISDKVYKENEVFRVMFKHHQTLETKMSARAAFNSLKMKVELEKSEGLVSTNTIMIYPPGIPICMPGEVINRDVIELLKFYQKQTIFTISETEDNLIEVVKEN